MRAAKNFTSSIGKKVVMAVTGLMMLGFVIAHLAGNLLIFLGPDALNAYAEKLRHLGELLWIARIVLIAAVLFHIWAAICLTLENRKARTVPYQTKRHVRSTFFSRTMMVSGILVLVFIVYHLLHYTFHVTNPDISHFTDARGRHDVFSMVVLSFQHVSISLAYAVAMLMLCLHLGHGAASWVQTLGFNTKSSTAAVSKAGLVFGVALAIGYISIPAGVLLGIIKK